jgi:hypothetical protein
MRRGVSDSGGRWWSGRRRREEEEEERPSAVLCCWLRLRGRGTWAAAAERKAAAREEEAMAGDGRALAGPLVGWWPLKEKAICCSVCGAELRSHTTD